jgi:hypothetical protein
MRFGSVGRAVDGAELRLESDGELLIRGPVVMRGYRGMPEATREAIDPDGWLHTGDIARIDDDGFLWIVDRKKELIINAAGMNMSPTTIEAKLTSAGPADRPGMRYRRPAALQRRAARARPGSERRTEPNRSDRAKPGGRRGRGPLMPDWPGSSRSNGSACSTASGCPAVTNSHRRISSSATRSLTSTPANRRAVLTSSAANRSRSVSASTLA